MTATATYRKTKTGQWVAFGPASMITAGATITVARRDGSTKTEHVASVGKAFTVDGQQCRYGYLSPSSRATPARRSSSSRRNRPYVPAGQRRCRDCGGPIDPTLDGASYGAPGYCFDCA